MSYSQILMFKTRPASDPTLFQGKTNKGGKKKKKKKGKCVSFEKEVSELALVLNSQLQQMVWEGNGEKAPKRKKKKGKKILDTSRSSPAKTQGELHAR